MLDLKSKHISQQKQLVILQANTYRTWRGGGGEVLGIFWGSGGSFENKSQVLSSITMHVEVTHVLCLLLYKKQRGFFPSNAFYNIPFVYIATGPLQLSLQKTLTFSIYVRCFKTSYPTLGGKKKGRTPPPRPNKQLHNNNNKTHSKLYFKKRSVIE